MYNLYSDTFDKQRTGKNIKGVRIFYAFYVLFMFSCILNNLIFRSQIDNLLVDYQMAFDILKKNAVKLRLWSFRGTCVLGSKGRQSTRL